MKMVLYKLVLIVFILMGKLSGLAQCDSLFLKTKKMNTGGLKLNGQSFVKEVNSSDDLDVSIVLSANRDYDFEIVGHKAYEVVVYQVNPDIKKLDKRSKMVILSSADEKDGLFTIRSEHYMQLNVHFKGVPGEKGKECTGLIIYAEDI